jgi:hypothetical protein
MGLSNLIFPKKKWKEKEISKFAKAFEEIRKNERDCRVTLRRYSFRKPVKRQVLVSKLDWFLFLILKKRNKRTICNNTNNKHHYINKNMSRIRFQRKFTFPTRSARRELINKQWLEICMGRRSRLTGMMRSDMFLFLQNIVTIIIFKIFCFGQALERKRELQHIKLE